MRDRIKPGRTSERDLVHDLIEALGAYNSKLMRYYHLGHDDSGLSRDLG